MEGPNLGKVTLESLIATMDKVRFGDITLIENYSSIGAELSLYFVVKYALGKGLPVLVEDVFDAFPGYMKHLEFMGIDFPIDGVGVVKIGGAEEYGHVVEKVQFEADPALYLGKKERAISRAMGDDRYVHVVVGFERLFGFLKDVKDVHVVANHLRELLGNESRMVFHIIDGNVIESFPTNPLPLLETVATSVVAIHDHGDMLRLRFRKSVFTFLEGRNEVLLQPADIATWL
ncbi:DUF257 family protein [Thermococcus prieurii]